MLIGQEYVSKCGQFHLRIVGFEDRNYTHPGDPFKDYTIKICGVYSHIPLTSISNGAISPTALQAAYVLKTETHKLLYVKE